VAETIAESGATPVRTKVGHSLIKDEMAASAAIFGGEHSAHYYFANFWGADNGMLAALHIISELGSDNLLMSQLSRANNPYFQSGEINSEVADSGAALGRLRSTFPEASVEAFDGHTFSGVDGSNWWWLNVRPSNTEPLLRLNVESISESTMQTIRDLAIRAIRN
jgi:phosphomannomutase